jgi:hypothetical protein
MCLHPAVFDACVSMNLAWRLDAGIQVETEFPVAVATIESGFRRRDANASLTFPGLERPL